MIINWIAHLINFQLHLIYGENLRASFIAVISWKTSNFGEIWEKSRFLQILTDFVQKYYRNLL